MDPVSMRGAIFDMDGTLLDTEKIYQETWRELAAEHGKALDAGFPAAVCGTTGEDTRRVIAQYIPGADPQDIVEQEMLRFRQKTERYVPLKPGVFELLEGLRNAGIPMAVASSSPEDIIRHHLTLAGIAGYFTEFVSGTMVSRGKPHPDIFLLAARRLGLDPAECYVFEDSLNGIRAGHAAGCAAVMVPDLVQPTEEIRALCALVAPDLSAAWRSIAAELKDVSRQSSFSGKSKS